MCCCHCRRVFLFRNMFLGLGVGVLASFNITAYNPGAHPTQGHHLEGNAVHTGSSHAHMLLYVSGVN